MSEKLKWRELKEIVNALPENILDQNVTVWNDSEDSGNAAMRVVILEEDHHYDGDEGCAPISVIKENYEDYEQSKETYPLVHANGTPILIVPDKSIV